MSIQEHKAEGAGARRFAVITVSDTRDATNDRGGDSLVEAVVGAGHTVEHRDRVTDDAPAIEAAVRGACAREGVELVLVTGGTGIAPRDVTVPTLEALFVSTIPGFGELFRFLSYEAIGSATILSRATAGVVEGCVVFALPGSPKALELAMRRIILPEAGHLVSQLRR